MEARARWEEQRENLIGKMGRPSFAAATALGRQKQEDKEERETPEPWRRGRAGTSVGRAVHAVLQSIDLATGDGIADRARAQAVAECVPGQEDEIARLSRIAVESDVVKRAVSSGCLWREVPVAVSTVAARFMLYSTCCLKRMTGWWWSTTRPIPSAPRKRPRRFCGIACKGGPMPTPSGKSPASRSRKSYSCTSNHAARKDWDGLAQAMQDAKEEAEALLDVAGE